MRLFLVVAFFCLSGCWLDADESVRIDMGGSEDYLNGCASYWRLGEGGESYLVNANLSNGEAVQIKVPFETSRVVAVPSKRGMISAEITKDKGTKLFFIEEDGSGFSPLKNLNRIEGKPALSPTSKRIAFHASTEEGGLAVKVADLNGAERVEIDCPEHKCHSPAWSIDGGVLYYLGGDRKVYMFSLSKNKGELVYLAKEGAKVTGVAEISPEKVLVSEIYGDYRTRNGGALKSVSLLDGKAESVVSGAGEIVSLSYAGSSDAVLYVKNIGLQSQRLYIYNIADAHEVAITKPGWIVGGASWNKSCVAGL